MRVYVVPGLWVANIRGIFLEAGYSLATKIQDAQIVVWTGGADIQPALYNERQIPEVYLDPERDKYEKAVFDSLPKTGGPLKVGICRGAQLLCALSGGKLWQHIEGHGRTHEVKDMATGELIVVSSLHHQEMIPPKHAEIWAKADEAIRKIKIVDGVRYTTVPRVGSNVYEDVEACYIPSTESFCYQPHPEIGPQSCTEYFFKLIDKALLAKASVPKKESHTIVSGLTDLFDKTLNKKDRENIEVVDRQVG